MSGDCANLSLVVQYQSGFEFCPRSLDQASQFEFAGIAKRLLLTLRRDCDSVEIGSFEPVHFTLREIGRATSELQSHHDLVCRLLLEKKKKHNNK